MTSAFPRALPSFVSHASCPGSGLNFPSELLTQIRASQTMEELKALWSQAFNHDEWILVAHSGHLNEAQLDQVLSWLLLTLIEADSSLSPESAADVLSLLTQDQLLKVVLESASTGLVLAALSDLRDHERLFAVVMKHSSPVVVRLAIEKMRSPAWLAKLLEDLPRDFAQRPLVEKTHQSQSEFAKSQMAYQKELEEKIKVIDQLKTRGELRRHLKDAHQAALNHLSIQDLEGREQLKQALQNARKRLQKLSIGEDSTDDDLEARLDRLQSQLENTFKHFSDQAASQAPEAPKESEPNPEPSPEPDPEPEPQPESQPTDISLIQLQEQVLAGAYVDGDPAKFAQQVNKLAQEISKAFTQEAKKEGSEDIFANLQGAVHFYQAFLNDLLLLKSAYDLCERIGRSSEEEIEYISLSEATQCHQAAKRWLTPEAPYPWQETLSAQVPLLAQFQAAYPIFNEKSRDILAAKRLRFVEYLHRRLKEIEQKLGAFPQYTRLNKQLDKVHQKFNDLLPAERDTLVEKWEALKASLSEQEAEHYAKVYPAQELLCEEAETLLKDASIVGPELLTQLTSLQKNWKTISKGIEHQIHWSTFDQLCHQIYDRYQASLDGQNELIAANTKARLALATEAEGFLNDTDWENPSWRQVASFCARAWAAWHASRPHDTKLLGSGKGRFQGSMKQVQLKLNQHYKEMIALKSNLIERAKALADQPLDEATKAAKLLQAEWKTIEHAGLSEASLWEAFSQACDVLFKQREALSRNLRQPNKADSDQFGLACR